MKFTIFWIVYYGIVGLSRSFKIQRPSSGGDLPQFRRVNSNTLTMFMDNDVEGGNLGPYADRPRVFPSMRSKVHTPLVNTIQYKKKKACYGIEPVSSFVLFLCELVSLSD